MWALISSLFDTAAFVPHGYCLLWRPDLVALHAISDLAIALAYFSIPLALALLAGRRQDLVYRPVFWLFATFIAACGLTHIVGLITLWEPVYGLQGVVKAATAVVSLGTAAVVWPILPRALALPSVNLQLQAEVAQRRDAEGALRRAGHDLALRNRRLEAMNAELDQFASVAAHDLRAPLRHISVLVSWLEEELGEKAPDGVRGRLAQLRERVRRMAALVEGLRDYAGGGVQEQSVREVDLHTVARDAIELAAPPERMAIELCGPLPRFPAVEPAVALVLRNLIGNAVKHHDREDGRIRVSAEERAGEVEIVVEDDGPGMPDGLRDQPFELFPHFRGGAGEAGGIGLPLVRRTVVTQGGRVWIDRSPLGGLAVHVIWPKPPASLA